MNATIRLFLFFLALLQILVTVATVWFPGILGRGELCIADLVMTLRYSIVFGAVIILLCAADRVANKGAH